MTASAALPDFDLFPAGFSAVVIGANRGIGRAIATVLIDHPRCGRVFAVCRKPDEADFDQRFEAIAADITDEASVKRAAEHIKHSATGVHLVMSTVGLLHNDTIQPERSLGQVSAEALAQSFAVNATGTILIGKHFAPLTAHKQHCVMAFLSARVGSIADNRLGGWYSYRASKAAQNQLIRTMAIEFKRRRGPICVALHPGTVDTALSAPFQANVPEGKLFSTEQSADYLLSVISGLKPQDTGQFFAWDGQAIPW